MMKQPWVAYVGLFMFPWGQPGSRRVYGICRALVDAGYKVKVGAAQCGGSSAQNVPECPGIEYSEVGELPAPGASKLQKAVQLFGSSGLRTVEWLSSMEDAPVAVICYGGGAPFMQRVMRWCSSRNIPVVADVVEWYDPTHMQGGFFGPFHISAKIAMHYHFPRCNGVIAISSLLESHYKSRCAAEVTRVPPLVDTNEIISIASPSESGRLRLIYAGAPGKKDLLRTTILGVLKANERKDSFELKVVGPTEQQVGALMGWARAPEHVHIAGPLPQQSVSHELQSAHFSVLLREPQLFANAGFSTKFVESFANGTPVIGNFTSDMRFYLKDKINGVVCEDHSLESFIEALYKIQKFSGNQMKNMRLSARNQAVESFDYRRFSSSIASFLEKLRK